MQSSKVLCAQCPHHRECPQKTRIYVNYCGADQKKMENRVRTAVLECRTRRGRLFIQGFLFFPDARQVFPPALSVSS
ncbi:MAG: hypothetical protein JXA71_08910 [Chitinispirillaceae bacterium]|nr:hypothetical protein [Chitinispirillaceae bacterium]